MDIRLGDLPEAVRCQIHADKRAEIAPSRANRLQGHQAQAAGKSFEQRVETAFPYYKDQDIARLFRMPVPTAPAPRHDQRARGLRVLSGTALWDVFGWFVKDGRAIGVEIKSTAKKERRLPIVGEGKKGSGLQKHQLDALASLAGCGGAARIVWRNGDEVGVLVESDILQAQARYAEGGRGTRSIPWTWFQAAEWPDLLGLTGKEKNNG